MTVSINLTQTRVTREVSVRTCFYLTVGLSVGTVFIRLIEMGESCTSVRGTRQIPWAGVLECVKEKVS